MDDFDASVNYSGPKAEFASITGSPLWGMSVGTVIETIGQHGWTLQSSKRIPTPYGLGPLVSHFITPSGRDILWIPTYGAIVGERMFSPTTTRKLFWILWQAGVKVLLVGGTSGTNDWRDPTDKQTVRPGDFVIPWSFYPSRDMLGTLPGTELATGFVPKIALLNDPFCLSLNRQLAEKARAELVPEPFRTVHTPDMVKVSILHPTMSTFETHFETLTWRVMTKLISEHENFPHVVIAGDCVSPVLARKTGIHMGYYHLPSNWVAGHPGTTIALTKSLDDLYLNVLPKVCLKMELELLESVTIPEDCTCASNLVERPHVYLEALTPADG